MRDTRKLESGESIEIVVNKDGVMTVKAVGVKGTDCTVVTKPFENLGTVLADKETSEMREEGETHGQRHRAL